MDGVVIGIQLPNQGLFVKKPCNFPEPGAERHEPFVVVGSEPVRRDDGRRG
jgi:hypothetical protein